MTVTDPISHERFQLEDAHTLPMVGDFIPVESQGGSHWFAVYAPTNQSRKLADLPDDVQREIAQVVYRNDLTEDMLNLCASERVLPTTLSRDVIAESVDALETTYGSALRARLVGRALAEGYTQPEINRALARLLDESMDDVETICVSALLEDDHV